MLVVLELPSAVWNRWQRHELEQSLTEEALTKGANSAASAVLELPSAVWNRWQRHELEQSLSEEALTKGANSAASADVRLEDVAKNEQELRKSVGLLVRRERREEMDTEVAAVRRLDRSGD